MVDLPPTVAVVAPIRFTATSEMWGSKVWLLCLKGDLSLQCLWCPPGWHKLSLPCFLCEQKKLWGLKRPRGWAKFVIFYALFAMLAYFSMDAQHSLIANSEHPLPRIQDDRASLAFSVWEKSLYWPNQFTCYISFRHTLYLHCPFLRKMCHFFSLFGFCRELKSAVFSTHHLQGNLNISLTIKQ